MTSALDDISMGGGGGGGERGEAGTVVKKYRGGKKGRKFDISPDLTP